MTDATFYRYAVPNEPKNRGREVRYELSPGLVCGSEVCPFPRTAGMVNELTVTDSITCPFSRPCLDVSPCLQQMFQRVPSMLCLLLRFASSSRSTFSNSSEDGESFNTQRIQKDEVANLPIGSQQWVALNLRASI